MKTYVLTISRTFPKTHKRAGRPTYFAEKISVTVSLDCLTRGDLLNFDSHELRSKIHTIRANYDLWKKRIDQVNEGNAILSIRYWSGKPYNSKQIEICQLKQGAVGIQKVNLYYDKTAFIRTSNNFLLAEKKWSVLAKNDGLSLEDFTAWFKGYDLNQPMAIIHFTKFRY